MQIRVQMLYLLPELLDVPCRVTFPVIIVRLTSTVVVILLSNLVKH